MAAAIPWSWFLVRDSRSLMDVVATGLPVVAAALAGAVLVVAALWRRPRVALVGLSVAAAGVVAVVGPWLPQATGVPTATSLRVVAANALYRNTQNQQAAADLLAQNADVVVVVENATDIYDVIRSKYPHAELGPEGAHLVLSRFPIRRLPNPTTTVDDTRLTRWELDTPSGSLVLYAVHLRRPEARRTSFIRRDLYNQRRDVAALLAAVRAERRPAMLVGDFNLPDRAWGYRKLSSQLRDGMRAGRAGPTYVRPRYRPFLLRIDHIFLPRNWCSADTDRFEIRGSDHLGVVARVGPCR